jgi:hypothetical protein
VSCAGESKVDSVHTVKAYVTVVLVGMSGTSVECDTDITLFYFRPGPQIRRQVVGQL